MEDASLDMVGCLMKGFVFRVFKIAKVEWLDSDPAKGFFALHVIGIGSRGVHAKQERN